MNRSHVSRVLVIAAGVLFASAAAADPNPNAAPPAKANAAAADAKKADDRKADDKKADDKKLDDKADKAKPTVEDREARKAKEHAAEKEQLEKLLKGPMDDATRQELRRHAERIAKIDRIKAVATDAKDKDVVDRATKLTDKENARHDKWMAAHANGGVK